MHPFDLGSQESMPSMVARCALTQCISALRTWDYHDFQKAPEISVGRIWEFSSTSSTVLGKVPEESASIDRLAAMQKRSANENRIRPATKTPLNSLYIYMCSLQLRVVTFLLPLKSSVWFAFKPSHVSHLFPSRKVMAAMVLLKHSTSRTMKGEYVMMRALLHFLGFLGLSPLCV